MARASCTQASRVDRRMRASYEEVGSVSGLVSFRLDVRDRELRGSGSDVIVFAGV